LVILNFYLGHIKELTYKSEDLLQNLLLVGLALWGSRSWKEMGGTGGGKGGGKNKRAIDIALASRLVTIQN
jgi:hypothetical protein